MKENIELSKNGILMQDSNESNNLLVSFGGIRKGIGMPIFEFYNSIKHLDCNKIFIRDFNQMWYQSGVDENITSIYELKNYIENFIKVRRYSNICFIGNSMGGYAAILLGTLLSVDHIIAFSPQTFIDKKNRWRSLDFRWRNEIKMVHTKNRFPEFFDLKNFLNSNQNNKSTINIHYNSTHRLDKKHASRLRDFEKISLYPYKNGGHNVIKKIKESGKLEIILNQIFN